MSRRNSLEAKRSRVARKNFRKKHIAYLDLVEYVKTRTHCTTGTAIKVILAGALKVDSHTIGFKEINTASGKKKMLERHVPSEWRDRIVVASLEELGLKDVA